MENKQLTYTLILHKIRKDLKLTLMEYCVADSIYHLSNNPKSEVKGWCYASKETISEILGTTPKTIFENIRRLIEKGFIIKEENTKHLKTTSKWYESVVLIKAQAEYNEMTQGITKGYSKVSRKVIVDYNETTYNNNKDININNNYITTHSVEDNKEIAYLIDLFKSVNPSYKQLFMRKPQREAVSRLLGSMGREKLEQAIKVLPEIRTNKYAPVITTPSQLEEKMGALISFLQRNSQSKMIKL